MLREDLDSFLLTEMQAVKRLMDESLSSGVPLLDSTNSEILSNSGKMLRPALCLLMAKACGGVTPDSISFAAASEILHNATLIHDDIADESAERRGRPTVASLLGASSAVLVGDFWLSRAMELVIGSSLYREVVPLYSKTLTDLAEGEMLQLEKASTADTTEEDYIRIISCKTASLFIASAVSGAVSAHASAELKEAAREYARSAGIAFQIKDDILDYVGDASLGKPVGADLEERKITLPLLCALDGSERAAEIRGLVSRMDVDAESRSVVADFVRERGGVESASRVLDAVIEKAVNALAPFPDGQAKDLLCGIVRYNTLRKA